MVIKRIIEDLAGPIEHLAFQRLYNQILSKSTVLLSGMLSNTE